jgi:hypothetical protein
VKLGNCYHQHMKIGHCFYSYPVWCCTIFLPSHNSCSSFQRMLTFICNCAILYCNGTFQTLHILGNIKRYITFNRKVVSYGSFTSTLHISISSPSPSGIINMSVGVCVIYFLLSGRGQFPSH